ncbi:MAG: baseplate J/gp47 family protein [Candidatus Sedimenticola sp. (ex Thyasira tokunagai)]
MSAFTEIDLSQLPAPDVVEALDFETILDAIKADFVARSPDHADVLDLESEPLVKLMESAAYVALTLRQRVNDGARAVMLAYAAGTDLEHLGALFGVERQLIDAGDPDATPPVPATYETDTRLRQRIQLSLEGHSTAGPEGAYIFWGLSASPLVNDIGITSPAPGEVLITVLSTEGDGTADTNLKAAVYSTVNADDVRPLTDQVTVQSATIIDYVVTAELTFYQGPDTAVVLAAATQAVTDYCAAHHRLGHDITISGLHAALHQAGVQNVNLTAPAADIVVGVTEAPHCSAITVTDGGTGE